MYYDLCLKFEDEATSVATLFTHMEYTENDSPKVVQVPKYTVVDVIGIISKPSGKTIKTPDGEVIELLPIPGWHVNVRHTAEMPELSKWVVTPKTPERTWA